MDRQPRNIEAIVEQQVRRWELERQRREASKPRPAITVSREFGARGADLARLVAERLGWKCWDRELLHEIAQHAKASETLFETLDEHRRDAIRETLAVFGAGRHVTMTDYTRELATVIGTIGEHGNAVVVGRGAQYLLAPQQTLRVRVVAPLAARIASVAERRSISEDKARDEVNKTDAERRAFMREVYDRDPNVASDHDLLINTATFALPDCAELIVAATRLRFGDLAPAATAP